MYAGLESTMAKILYVYWIFNILKMKFKAQLQKNNLRMNSKENI